MLFLRTSTQDEFKLNYHHRTTRRWAITDRLPNKRATSTATQVKRHPLYRWINRLGPHTRGKQMTWRTGNAYSTYRKKSIPWAWSLYRIIWRLDQFTDILENAEKYEKRLSNVRAPYCDPNSIKDLCSPIFFSQPFDYTFHLRAYPFGVDTAKGKYMSVCLAIVLGPLTRSSLGLFKTSLSYTFSVRETHPSLTSSWLIVTNNNNSECFKKHIPTSSNTAVTILCFIPLDELMNSENPWLKNDSIFFEVKVMKTLYPLLSTYSF